MSSPVDPARVWTVLSLIPEGKVVTYGQLAELSGAPRAARVVGNILRQLPAGSSLPWHRVINSKGHISFPEGSSQHAKQRARLEEEGITLLDGKINLSLYCWQGE